MQAIFTGLIGEVPIKHLTLLFVSLIASHWCAGAAIFPVHDEVVVGITATCPYGLHCDRLRGAS